MNLLKQYFKLQEEIYEYFGYVEDWVVMPMDDATQYNWELLEDEVSFSEDLEDDSTKNYVNEIYKQRFLPKHVYRGEEYTMICVDTRVDGNKFLQIFDNKKELNRGDT